MATQPIKRGWKHRLKMVARHTSLLAMAGLLLCAGLVAVVSYILNRPTTYIIAVGPPNSEDTRVVQAMTQHLARDRATVRLRPMILQGGTRDAMAAIDRGTADFAVVRHDIGMPRDGSAIAIWRKNVAVFIVPAPEPPVPAVRKGRRATVVKPAKIEKIGDLVGKRLGVVGRSPTNINLLKTVVLQFSIPADSMIFLNPSEEAKPNTPGKITVVQFDPNNVGAAIRESKIKPDAILSVGPVGSTITADAIAASIRNKEPPSFIEINAAEAIAERNPVYELTEIKAGAFGGAPPQPEETIETIGVNHYLVARNTLSEDVVADLTKRVFAMRQVLATEIPSSAKIETPDTSKDGPVPVHPGAAAYIDGELKTFFDRYSDLLYLGLMLVSFLGSGLVGLASYSKSDERERRTKSLEKLVEIIALARKAELSQALDELQAAMDGVHDEMVREVESNALDQSTLTAFQVSFEQTRAALADRRAILMSSPPRPRAAVASA